MFSAKTMASAWGSGREGAPGAPVFEENTSAVGLRASKHQSVETDHIYHSSSLQLYVFHVHVRRGFAGFCQNLLFPSPKFAYIKKKP